MDKSSFRTLCQSVLKLKAIVKSPHFWRLEDTPENFFGDLPGGPENFENVASQIG